MVNEIDFDVARDQVYVSNYLNARGAALWLNLIREAAETGNDVSLAVRIQEEGLLKNEVERRKPKGGFTMAKVPYTAHETLGEGEFTRYYVRGLCVRAIDEGIPHLTVYRAKSVAQPRPGSEEKIGHRFNAAEVLKDLRETVGVEPLLGLPPGPNSGLCVHIN
jgi:hypothetical protein